MRGDRCWGGKWLDGRGWFGWLVVGGRSRLVVALVVVVLEVGLEGEENEI